MKLTPSTTAAPPDRRLSPVLGGLLLLVASCSTLPDEDIRDHYYAEHQRMAEEEIAELREQRDDGEISRETFDVEVTRIQDELVPKVNNALYRDYQLRKSSRGQLLLEQ